MAEHRGWFAPALAVVGAVTLARIVLLALNRTDLFVDEAQYWLWGQELAFGYYSKPPLIGWVIRASTELAGSDAAFWVRLPAPLLHAATALILGRIAAGLWGRGAGVVAAASYVTLPMVAVASLLISTDTVMFPFLAAALGLWLWLMSGQAARPVAVATGAGAALGLAFLGKYAAVYYLLLATVAALHPLWRPGARPALAALGAFALVALPNVIWNLMNGLTTVSHTMDNAGWIKGGAVALHPGRAAEFLVAQLGVFGPVAFVLLAGLALRRLAGPVPRVPGLLILLSVPIVALIAVQGLLERAYANWAAAAYVAGTLAIVPWLSGRRWLLILSFAVNGAVSLALPLATVWPEAIWIGREPLLHRYIGRAEVSRRLLDAADRAGAVAIVTGNRDLLADLFHTGRDSPVAIHAVPVPGNPPHYYAQKHALEGPLTGPILAVDLAETALPCTAERHPSDPLVPGPGEHFGNHFRLWIVPGDCWGKEAR